MTVLALDRDALIQGVDTSSYDGNVDWMKVAETKKFAWLRVSHGLEHDKTFAQMWPLARAAGVIRGAYHYFLPNQPLQPQIDYFIQTIGKLEPGDLPPCLDLEEPEAWASIPKNQRVPLILKFLNALEKAFGITPFVYMSPNFVESVLGTANAAPLKRYPLWIANYRVPQPKVPAPWTDWLFWQFEAKGTVPGIPNDGDCDLDVFCGSMDQLMALTFQRITEHQVMEAASDYVQGIDVSTYQLDIDWDKVAKAKKKFAFIRVSHGLAIQDDKFQYNWRRAREVGVIRGPYHYFDPREDVDAQITYFINTIGSLQPGDFAPVLDCEDPNAWAHIEQRDRVPLIIKVMDRIEKAFGVTPELYGSPNFFTEVLGSQYIAPLGKYNLWIANYRVPAPSVPRAWSDWTFWQYSDKGKVTGINADVDLDAYNGTLEQLKRRHTVKRACGPAVAHSRRCKCKCAKKCT